MSEHVRTNVTYRCKSGDWRIEAGRGRAEICEDRKNENFNELEMGSKLNYWTIKVDKIPIPAQG